MPKLLVVAGEASGDLHGGNVIKRLKGLMPELELIGTGGKHLEEAGCKLVYRVEDLAVIGIWEVLKRYSYYKGIFDHMVRLLDEQKPDAVFLVDYPGFNLKFAKEAKDRGIKVYYYVAPQVWAWKKNRIEKIRAYVDELIVLFPFEVEWFRKEGMHCHCFGHPLLEIAKPQRSRAEVFAELGLEESRPTLAILPGSRENEIKKHLGLLVECVNLLSEQKPELQFIYPVAPTVDLEEVRAYFAACRAKVELAQHQTYDLVAASDFALVASGTATLETAILETPLLIFYRTTKATHWIGKNILGIGLVGLPNIVAGRQILPELIQSDFNPREMARVTLEYLDDQEKYQELKTNLAELKASLGELGAYDATAAFLRDLLQA